MKVGKVLKHRLQYYYGQRPPYHWKRTCRDAFRRRQSYGDLGTKQIIIHGGPSDIEEFLKRVQCVVWKRRLFGMKRLSYPRTTGTIGNGLESSS